MYPLIETIACLEGKLLNLEYHQRRVNRSLDYLGTENKNIDLMALSPPYNVSGRLKCKVTYDANGVRDIVFSPYKVRPISSMKCIHDNEISYGIKSADRTALNRLASGLGKEEDMIIIKEGYVTDSWYANLAFFDGKEWFTPNTPLLEGVKRQKLLDNGSIKEEVIKKEDIFDFKHVSLINAMLDLDNIKIGITNIKK